MPASRRYRKIKIKLWKKDRKCHYCGNDTVLAKSGEKFKGDKPLNLATLDHYYSKWDIRRLLPQGENKVVLCCHYCNHSKNEREMLEIGDRILYVHYANNPVIDIHSFLDYQNKIKSK